MFLLRSTIYLCGDYLLVVNAARVFELGNSSPRKYLGWPWGPDLEFSARISGIAS